MGNGHAVWQYMMVAGLFPGVGIRCGNGKIFPAANAFQLANNVGVWW